MAAVAWSTAGILQRELSVGLATQLAGRALFAVLAILAYVTVAERGALVRAFRATGRGGLAIAALMAISSGSFITALNHSSVANVLFMQAIAPILAAAPFANPGSVGLRDLGLLVALGVGQIGLGLVLLAIGARLIPAAEVALISLLEIVLG
ncbi:MAG: hypothetical protein ACJ77N_02280, partial [Chloroflexota bacterium]